MHAAHVHRLYERLLARILISPDPEAALHLARQSPRLPPSLREQLARIDVDGLRLSALLVAKLRFERLLRGCPEAERWFDDDAAEFSSAFRRYHREVAPTGFFPSDEARLFRRWLAGRRARRT